MKLNDQQRAIVEAPIDVTLKVSAGAGTGKTRVLVERYLRFVFDLGIDPERLLALTFTKKAAAEMQGRVYREVVKRGDKQLLRAMYRAWIMNFHQFAYRVIRENATEFGIDPDITIASEVEIDRIARDLRRRFEAGEIDLPHYDDDMPAPNRLDSYFDKCMKIVEKARSSVWTPESFRASLRDADLPGYRRYVETVVALWHGYEGELHGRGMLDFNDLIRIVVAEFEKSPTLLDYYVKRFDHILVDEFQDTSEAQGRLLNLLSGGSFEHTTVVGDEKQSIYRWRDARVENIREFGGEEAFLSVNYRSKGGILDAAHRLIIGDPYFGGRAEDIELVAERGGSTAPICFFHPTDEEGASHEAEARALGAWILSVTGGMKPGTSPFAYYAGHSPDLPFDKVAILMRSLKPSSGLPEYEKELQRLRVPYAIVGGVSEVEDHVLEQFKSLLRLLIYPNDVTALLSVLESRPFRIPDSAIEELFKGKRAWHEPFHVWSHTPAFAEKGLLADQGGLARVADDEVRARLEALRNFLETLEERRGRSDLPAFITQAMDLAQFYYRLFDEGADTRIVDSVSKRVFELIEHLVQKGEPNLAAFIEAVETLLAKKQFGEEDAPYVPEGRVVIMTQHQAKGLEFPAVAVPGIRKASPRSDGFYLVKDDGLYLSEEGGARDSKNCAERDKSKAEDAQEERCLLYVAMTRAEDHLFIGTSTPGGLNHHKKPSLFADVLDAVRAGDIPHEEKRGVDPAEPLDEEAPPALDRGVVKLLDEWREGSERIEETRALARPALGGVELVTWRGLYAFARCPLQYYYAYVARVQEDLLTGSDESKVFDEREVFSAGDLKLPRGVDPAQFGSYVHRLLFEWQRGDRRNAGELAQPAIDLAERLGIGANARKACADIAVGLAKQYVTHAGDAGAWRLECPVRRRHGDIIFHGIVDRIDRTGNGLEIMDYKVGQEHERYAYQVRFYAWLLGAASTDPVTRGSVVYLQKDSRRVEVQLRDTERIGEVATLLGEAVEDCTYDASPGVVCESCDYRSACPYSLASGEAA